MVMPNPPPVGGPALAPGETVRARIQRLRGQLFYKRTASPAEIEADLGALRALTAMYGPFQNALLGLAVLLFLGSGALGVALGMALRSRVVFFGLAGIGLVSVAVVIAQYQRLPGLARQKIEVASSLVRRLDVVPGGEITLSLGLRPGDGMLTRDEKVASSFWAGTSTFSKIYQDDWLGLEAPLASGAHLTFSRTGLKMELVSTQSGGNTTTVRTRTSRVFRDTIAVRYDPAANPQLAPAGAQAAGALRLGADAKVGTFENQPGWLSVVVGTGPRADGTSHPQEIAATIAAVAYLAAPARPAVSVDREVWAPEMAAEAEAKREGLGGALRTARGASAGGGGTPATAMAMVAGGGLAAAFALLLCVGGVSLLRTASDYTTQVEQQDATIARTKATLAKAKLKVERDTAQSTIDAAKSRADLYRGFIDRDQKQAIVQFVAGGVLLAGGVVVVVLGLRRRRRAREQAQPAGAPV
jgi:hypothetical protein